MDHPLDGPIHKRPCSASVSPQLIFASTRIICAMNIERAVPADAEALSELALSAAQELRETDFSAEGWQHFVNTVSPSELSRKITSKEFLVFRCSAQGRVLGFLALKDGEKVDQLFVRPDARNKGIATSLWQTAKAAAAQRGPSGRFWVRSSSVAVPVYQRFGFVCAGERTSFNGIHFQLMQLAPDH